MRHHDCRPTGKADQSQGHGAQHRLGPTFTKGFGGLPADRREKITLLQVFARFGAQINPRKDCAATKTRGAKKDLCSLKR